MLRALACALVLGSAPGCGGKPPPTPPPTAPTTNEPRKALTPEQCAAAGGEVVGDIGDGAVHRPDYRCPRSGEPPLGPIEAEPGKPMGVEGAVCCR